MAIPHHDNLEFVAGDDWDIGATLQRSDGSAYDLSQATVIWMLRDPNGDPALTSDQYSIKINSPPSAGLITIVIPAGSTAGLRPGRYLDWLRATDNAGTDTFWTGMILVDANPWGD